MIIYLCLAKKTLRRVWVVWRTCLFLFLIFSSLSTALLTLPSIAIRSKILVHPQNISKCFLHIQDMKFRACFFNIIKMPFKMISLHLCLAPHLLLRRYRARMKVSVEVETVLSGEYLRVEQDSPSPSSSPFNSFLKENDLQAVELLETAV